jgi:hypothetical protein
MKNILLVLALLIFLGCKKEDPAPEPQDYADDITGTYIGSETYATPISGTITYSNASKTLTVVRTDINKVRIQTFYSVGTPTFITSDGTGLAGFLSVVVSDPSLQVQGTASGNSYESSTKILRLNFTHPGVNGYIHFQGTKQ